jgi:hypothetical protein
MIEVPLCDRLVNSIVVLILRVFELWVTLQVVDVEVINYYVNLRIYQ